PWKNAASIRQNEHLHHIAREARVSLPSNYLIDVTQAVSRAMSFFGLTDVLESPPDHGEMPNGPGNKLALPLKNGTNFPDGFEVNQWKDFKISSATGSASIASGLGNSVDASKL
ncbi:hypothetical protein ALC60_03614, partial [Trachymyrmex zeteki]